MDEVILSTKRLSKRYGSVYALKDCTLTVKKGQIYGLVGRNGAGKTTLMRLVCGQSPFSNGEISLFGSTDEQALIENRKRIGCMIEAPAFYPNFSARKNLKLYCMKKGIPKNGQIEEILRFVGLADTGKKPFSQFSLGMKERLGLALALLGNPEFLVLDEPTNGLDPIGIAEIRELVLKLNREKNVTVLLSSHILRELSMISTHYGFIENGRLVAELSAAELSEKCKLSIFVKVDDTAKAVSVLERFCGCKNYRVLNDSVIRIYENIEHPEQINRELAENGVLVYSITNEGKDLEKFFLDLVGEEGANA